MADHLLPSLTEKTLHLCVDMERIFSAEGPWATPWMKRVLGFEHRHYCYRSDAYGGPGPQ